jgi:FkbM family methyltransferase
MYRRIFEECEKLIPTSITPWGWSLSGSPQMASGAFEKETVDCVRDLLSGCDIFVNIGANVGFFCCHALEMGKPVVAVEPLKRNLYYLLRNISQQVDWPEKCEVWPLAAGSKTGIAKIWGWTTGASLIQGWAGQPEEYFHIVPVTSIDRLLVQRLKGLRALILVDVEGYELGVLQGASEVLRMTPRPTWIIEVAGSMHQPNGSNGNPNYHATFNLMGNAGYKAWLPKTFKKNTATNNEDFALLLKKQDGQNYVFHAPSDV